MCGLCNGRKNIFYKKDNMKQVSLHVFRPEGHGLSIYFYAIQKQQ